MAADWDEIRRLAADLQRAQLGSTVQRLSERNCIELVNKVVELKLVEVVFTSDGKEYITPEQVVREIKDELLVRGGRIDLVDLTHILNLDFSHIETKVNELVKNEYTLNCVLGQLLTKEYLDHIAEEINERLQQNGQVTIGELIKQYDLPASFIQELIENRLGTIIFGKTDSSDNRIFFTDAFVSRHKSRILGALTAIMSPTPILNIINHHNFHERLFHTVVNELIASGALSGSIAGGRQERAIYIPSIYSKAQNEWVDSFYKQNGYLEYDALTRLGISEPASFAKKLLKGEVLTYLKTCLVGQSIVDQIDAAVDEALTSGTWVDIMPILPSICGSSDAHQLLQNVLKTRSKQVFSGQVFNDSMVCSDKFIQQLMKPFDSLMATKAEKDVQNGVLHNLKGSKGGVGEGDCRKDNRKEERRKKAAGGKSGGGTQGRETKMKSVKKKYRANKDSDDSDDEESQSSAKSSKMKEVEFMSVEEIVTELERLEISEECPEELLNTIAEHIHRPLTKSYEEVVRSVFLASSVATGATRRKTHQELQEKVNGLLVNVRLFEKGLKLFADDIQSQLSKHLLKTIGTDVANLIFSYVAQENLVSVEDKPMTAELRTKVLANVPADIHEPLSKLNTSLNGKSVEDFLTACESASCPGVSDIAIKKLDKKKERQVAFGHRQALLEQLSSTVDCALALHLTVLVLFQLFTHCLLHASGKFVPQILALIEPQLTPDTAQFLRSYQGLVFKLLTLTDDPDQLSQVKTQMEEMLPKVKEIAMTTKKPSHSED